MFVRKYKSPLILRELKRLLFLYVKDQGLVWSNPTREE